jgi:hypothetical protein
MDIVHLIRVSKTVYGINLKMKMYNLDLQLASNQLFANS